MHPELVKLLELQTQDLALRETDLRVQALAAQITGLDAEMERAREAATAAHRRLEEGVRRREELEKTIEAQRTQQENRRSRIEQVRTAREVQALMVEMDQARSVVARSESEWVKAAETTQQQEGLVKEAEEHLALLETDQTGERARLAAELAALEAERIEAARERDAAAAGIERAIRLRYDRLWSARLTVVVVPLQGDACGACYTAVPRNRRSQIRAGTHIDGCEACGVILYPVSAEP